MTLAPSPPVAEAHNMLLATLERRSAAERPPRIVHLLWFCGGLALFFGTAWIGTDVLHLDNDFYYAVYTWLALTFWWAYARHARVDVVYWVTQRWRSSLFVGALVGIYVVAAVLQVRPTARPGGLLIIFEVAWRGVAYGVVDALVLTAFPVAVAFGLVRGRTVGARRRAMFTVLSLVLVWTMSAVYHAGFHQFGRGDLVAPTASATVLSLPAVLTTNPVGSIGAEVALHVAATIETFESDIFVPPRVDYIPDFEPPGVFGDEGP